MGNSPFKITHTMDGEKYCPLKRVSVEERAMLLMWKQIVPGCHFKDQLTVWSVLAASLHLTLTLTFRANNLKTVGIILYHMVKNHNKLE